MTLSEAEALTRFGAFVRGQQNDCKLKLGLSLEHPFPDVSEMTAIDMIKEILRCHDEIGEYSTRDHVAPLSCQFLRPG